MRIVTKSPPYSIQQGVWPRVRCFRTKVQRRNESRKLLIRRHPNHLQHHVRPRRQNTLTPRRGRHKYAKLPTEIRKRRAVTHSESMQLSVALAVSTRSKCVISRRNGKVKVSGADASPAMARDACCLLPRSPCRGPRSRPKTSGRRLTSRPTLNVLSRRSSALRCLVQSCGHCPCCCDQICLLSGALSHHQHPMRFLRLHHRCHPAAVVVVATLTIFAATLTATVPAIATVAASPFSPVAFRQLFLRGSAERKGRGPRRGP